MRSLALRQSYKNLKSLVFGMSSCGSHEQTGQTGQAGQAGTCPEVQNGTDKLPPYKGGSGDVPMDRVAGSVPVASKKENEQPNGARRAATETKYTCFKT